MKPPEIMSSKGADWTALAAEKLFHCLQGARDQVVPHSGRILLTYLWYHVHQIYFKMMDAWMDAWMDGWMDGWQGGRGMERGRDSWMNR